MTLTVHVRDGNLRRLGELDDYSKLDLRLRTCDVAPWSLTCPADHPMALALTFTGGIIVTRPGMAEPVMSGSVTDLSVSTAKDDAGVVSEVLEVTGVDDNDVLAGRLALPAPLGGTADYDDHSGPAETVLRGFVDRNLGPSALPGRRIPDLVLEPDLGRGPTVRGRPDRYDQLLPFLRDLALGAGVSFRVVQVGRTRVVRFRTPADLSRSVVFGIDRSNLLDYSYRTARPTGNYAFVGGQGDLAARQVLELPDTASIAAYGRREVFVDERNAPTDDGGLYLQQKGSEALVAGSASSGLKITPTDTADTRYGVDYQLDDIVSVRLRGGATVVDRVSEVRLVVEGGVETLTPVVASDGANLSGVNLVQRLRRMGRALTRIESRT